MKRPSFHALRARFASSSEGTVAIEFAFIAPILLILLLGTFEISKYIQTNNQVVEVVNMVGQMTSQLPAAAKVSEVQRIWSASPLIAPESLRVAANQGAGGWSDVLSVTITSIVFTKRVSSCETDCEYEANVAWSVGQSPTPCGKLPRGSQAQPGVGAVPDEFFREGSVLSVRSTLPYQPYLIGTSSLLGTVGRTLTATMSEGSWFLPRNAPRIVLSAGGASSPRATFCPGFTS